MAVGTTNTKSTLVDGNTLPAAEVDDLATLLARADDEVLFDLYDIEPPSGASATNVNVGYIPLRTGPIVLPIGGSHGVIVQPARWCRSSTDNAQPRRMLSGTVNAQTIVTLPTAPSAGLWGIELLYAQLAYIDATDPAKGTQVTFNWAPSPTYVALANAANIATLPANTSTTWNIPVAYVRNYAGMTFANARDILSPTPSTSGGKDGKLRRRIQAAGGGINAHRGYASTTQALATLVAANTVITSSNTHPGVHKGDSEVVVRTFNFPATMTGSTAGVGTFTDVDDTRDWRNATFLSFISVAAASGGVVQPLYLGEEQSTTGAATDRQAPLLTMSAWYPPLFGQSFETYPGTPGKSLVGIATSSAGIVPPLNAGVQPFFAASPASGNEALGLVVDSTTGVLQLFRNVPAAGVSGGAGGPVSIFLIATFPNNSR